MKKSVIVIIILAAFLAGCGPAQSAQSPEAIQGQINTAVAQTMEGEQRIADSVAATINAQAPLSTPTAVVDATFTPTTVPSFTPTLVIGVPTVTTVPVNPPSGGGVSSGGGSSSPTNRYACSIIGEKPYDGAAFKPGDSFDKHWTIKNTGTVTWGADWDFEYKGGTDMSPTGNFRIGKEVKPGASISLVIEVEAPTVDPKETGKTFVMTWSLNNGSHFCTPYVAIRVFTPGTQP